MNTKNILQNVNFSGNIVSLLASTTEIICALGLKNNLVGISHECDNPKEILNLPIVSYPNIDTKASSKEIDSSVMHALSNNSSIYNINNELLKSLKPDFIFLQDHCNVCAISPEDLEIFFQDITNKNCKIIRFSPNTIDEMISGIYNIGKELDCENNAHIIINNLKNKLRSYKNQNLKLTKKYNVAFIEWIEPLFYGGNWIPEIIEYAGAKSIFGNIGEHSTTIGFEKIKQNNPDFILISPCGFDIKKTLSELNPLLNHHDWKTLKAVKNNKIFILDGNKYFNRSGLSIIPSIEIIKEIIYTKNSVYNFENSCWVNLNNIL